MTGTTRTASQNLTVFLAQGFASGRAPKAPGTFGSLVAILPWILFHKLSMFPYLALVLACILGGIYLCGAADQILGGHDNKSIVWDEFCGIWITLYAVPLDWLPVTAGFLLFRFFDIVKPWPISWLDRNLDGGLGVMADDILAGLLSWICLQGLLILF